MSLRDLKEALKQIDRNGHDDNMPVYMEVQGVLLPVNSVMRDNGTTPRIVIGQYR